MEEGFRIPDISEFKQGFKFQRLVNHKGNWNIWDFSSKNRCESNPFNYNEWIDCQVWWDREPKLITSELDEGVVITYMEHPEDLRPIYNLDKEINNGNIRVML